MCPIGKKIPIIIDRDAESDICQHRHKRLPNVSAAKNINRSCTDDWFSINDGFLLAQNSTG